LDIKKEKRGTKEKKTILPIFQLDLCFVPFFLKYVFPIIKTKQKETDRRQRNEGSGRNREQQSRPQLKKFRLS
jgi:hypothetical protein